MFRNKHSNSIEPLEARIAPAAVYPTIAQAEAEPNGAGFVTAQVGTPVIVHAGQVLTTGVGPQSGTYLMFVQQGEALVFVTDLNNNGIVDPNEITGIAAGNGLRLISFVDIHGDIMTDLNANGTLTDSQNHASLSNPALGGDGRVLLDNSISLIEFRSLLPSDLTPGENINLRYAQTNYSLYGNIYAGKSFGTADGGLIFDNSQAGQVVAALNPNTQSYSDTPGEPSVGGIYVGTAASGQFFSFGLSRGDNLHPSGTITNFVPTPGEGGGSIMNVGAPLTTGSTTPKFNIGVIHAGDGGIGAAGGSILNTTINGSDAGGYTLIAGNGGNGPTGGAGGSILNYTDLGSVTGNVLIESGNGGIGSTGVGGAGGQVTFGTATVAAGLTIELGNGGNGFTSGGAGASLPSGALITQTFGVAPNATFVVSTMHTNGSVGQTVPIDFNGDGIQDVVYGTQNPDTLVVLLGAGNGIFTQRIVFPLPSTDIADVTVGDFLGNGHLDIAAVSNDATENPGVMVLLSNFSKTGQFLGFDAPRWSPLPDLISGDPTQGLIANFGFLHANAPGSQIVSGDFLGDGRVELAVSATYYTPTPNPNQPKLHQVVVFLQPDLVDGVPDGQFYANFGTTQPANLLVPFHVLGNGSTSFLEATALTTTSANDVVVGDVPGAKSLSIMNNAIPALGGPATSAIAMGNVDTNRLLGSNNFAPTQVSIADFTVLDFNKDGKADFVALSSNPVGYMISIEGNGSGGGSISSGTTDNEGTFFGNLGFQIGTQQELIRTANLDPSGTFDNVAVLDYDSNSFGNSIYGIVELTPVDVTNINYSPSNPGAIRLNTTIESDLIAANNTAVRAFDTYGPGGFITALPDTNPQHFQALEYQNNQLGLLSTEFTAEVLNSININAGNGGNGLVGAGGAGGNLGSVLKAQTVTSTVTGTGATGTTVTTTVSATELVGALSITLPFDTTFDALVVLTAGSGGNGFTSGGSGGNVQGITAAYGTNQIGGTGLTTADLPTGSSSTTLDALELIAGNGGSGVSGAGGNGGSLISNSVEFGEFFQAGNGGTGAFGGNGGSIIGVNKTGFFDSLDTTMELLAGQGANGVKSGGNGGSILNFHASFNFSFIGSTSGDFELVGGDGGNASSGPGGNGGSLTNDSPLQSVQNPGNYMAGDIFMQGGHGGNGASGGNGGSIANFVDQPSNSIIPALLSLLAGNAGNGVSGPGGHGGSVSAINVPSSGQPSTSEFVAQLSDFNYDRILAGNGGSSAGNVGGDGGSITSIVTTNNQSGFAVIAGAGGSGLYAGGAGGQVANNNIQLGGTGGISQPSDTKLLVIAGAGGNATAWIPDQFNDAPDQAEKAFGGRVGQAGNGGDINGLIQAGGVAVDVDLIAGNGGDTVNYGVSSDSKFFVGTGGSVVNVKVTGEIGNIDPSVPIKSYNDAIHGQTIADFVDVNFRNNPDALDSLLDDNLGSVGIVVGAAGRLQSSFVGYDSNNQPLYQAEPAAQVHNGSLILVHADRGIEAAVAGSVDAIGAIAKVQDVSVSINSIGTDKDGALLGGADGFLDAQGNPIASPVAGGSLIDGALITATKPTARDAAGQEVQVQLPGNIYVLQ